MCIYWAGANALCPSWSFLPKAEKLEGGEEIVFVGSMVVGALFIAFAVVKLADQLCDLSSAQSAHKRHGKGTKKKRKRAGRK